MPGAPLNRILLKLSGESLKGKREFGIDHDILEYLVTEVSEAAASGTQISLVLGGGNIVRGADHAERQSTDYAGMMATIINGIFMYNTFTRRGAEVRMQSTFRIPEVAEEFIPRRAIRHMELERLVIFVGGTGLPLMSTDTAAALRAVEINADALLMAKYAIDGVYDADPKTTPDARKLDATTYRDIMSKRLKVMDGTAASLCLENKLNAVVFDIFKPGNLLKLVRGERVGTTISH